MIPELTVLENMEEIKTIWNETVTNPHHCIDYAIKSIKKRKNEKITIRRISHIQNSSGKQPYFQQIAERT